MSVPPPTDGLTITYQGMPCLPYPFRYDHSAGLGAARGLLYIHSSDYKGSLDTFKASGPLEIREVIDGEPHVVRIEDVFLGDAAVEEALAIDDGDNVAKIELTDIRSLYAQRGVVSAAINVPVQGSGGASAADKGAGTRSRDQLPALQPGSMDGGKPWTLRRTLTEVVLPKLPGAPSLRRMPKSSEGLFPVGHLWDARPARECLQALLQEFRLEFTRNLDSTVSLWEKGEGELQDAAGTYIASGLTPQGDSSGTADDRLASAKRSLGWNHTPRTVLVVGPPIIRQAELYLEPVGEVDGQILPLTDALNKIGFTFAIARKLALQSAGMQERMSLAALSASGNTSDINSGAAIAQFRKWAFKLYRIRDAQTDNSDKLPILKGRAETDGSGVLARPVVESENFGFATNAIALDEIFNNAGAAFGAGAGGNANAVGYLIASQHADQLCVGFNSPRTEHASGFSIDHTRGLVHFDAPQGQLEEVGLPHELSQISQVPAAVLLRFAYLAKPKVADQLSLEHRYHAFFGAGENGKTAAIDEGLADELVRIKAENASVYLIERPDLQQVEGDLGSNKAALDAIAKAAADAVLNVPTTIKGSVATFGRPVPVELTGKVLSVSWSTDNDCRPKTEAHVGYAAPLAPPPEGQPGPLQTREKKAPTDSGGMSKGLQK